MLVVLWLRVIGKPPLGVSPGSVGSHSAWRSAETVVGSLAGDMSQLEPQRNVLQRDVPSWPQLTSLAPGTEIIAVLSVQNVDRITTMPRIASR